MLLFTEETKHLGRLTSASGQSCWAFLRLAQDKACERSHLQCDAPTDAVCVHTWPKAKQYVIPRPRTTVSATRSPIRRLWGDVEDACPGLSYGRRESWDLCCYRVRTPLRNPRIAIVVKRLSSPGIEQSLQQWSIHSSS